jgi:hypothetical protein
VPNANDRTDQLLGQELCSYAERAPLSILFLRESEGVYKFGQKRVYIKIGKQNQILVKVGGGFLRMDEFVKMYTDEEVSKVSRNNVVNRFISKLEIQKIAANMSMERLEQSPIRSPQRPSSTLSSSRLRSHSRLANQRGKSMATIGFGDRNGSVLQQSVDL